PAWSPDNKQLAFFRNDISVTTAVVYELCVIKADGTGLKVLRTTPTADRPAWSPDGSKIAFGDGDTGGISFISSNDGSGYTHVTVGFDRGSDLSPSWSPDGTQIVFTG